MIAFYANHRCSGVGLGVVKSPESLVRWMEERGGERERGKGEGEMGKEFSALADWRESTEPFLRKEDPYLLLRPVDEFFIYFFCLL